MARYFALLLAWPLGLAMACSSTTADDQTTTTTTTTTTTGGGATGGTTGSTTGGTAGATGGSATTGSTGIISGRNALPTFYTARLRVSDATGLAIDGASVAALGTTFTTDSAGVVSVSDLPVAGVQSVTVTMAGYMSAAVQLAYADAGQKTKTVVLRRPAVNATLDANSPATIDLSTHSIGLAQSAFVDSSGTSYAGRVHINADALAPAEQVLSSYGGSTPIGVRDDFNLDTVTAGSTVMQDASGQVRSGFTEGVVHVEATDDAGNPLAISPTTPATVHMGLTPYTRHQPGDTLPLMSMDPNSGRWVQQSTCIVAQQAAPKIGLECVGTVTHFSAVAVPAAGTSNQFPCGNFNVTVDPSLDANNISLWLEEVVTADRAVRSPHAVMLDPRSLCYVGALPTVRVAMEATVDGNVTIFRSDTQTLPSVAMGANALDGLQAGSYGNACYVCEVYDVYFTRENAVTAVDADGDGYYTDGDNADCNDSDPTVHPGAVETPCDTVDKNCDGIKPTGSVQYADATSDNEWNQVFCALSCAQTTAEVPGNGVDENCDGIVSDRDNDGYFNAFDPALAQARATAPNTRADCDDQNPNAHPGTYEVAGNTIDEDCDGFAVDVDGDGYVARSQYGVNLQNISGLQSTANLQQLFNDCDDWDPTINPNVTDLTREAVLAAYYLASQTFDGSVRSGALCALIGADGSLNAAGRGLLLDVNCDGFYTDLDGDGYTAPGDSSLGAGLDVDCDDLDPRRNTAAGCPAPTFATYDGGSCNPGAPAAADCSAGYGWSSVTASCQDINECGAGNANCSNNQICINTPGSYVCQPPPQLLTAGPLQLMALNSNSIAVSFGQATNNVNTVTYSVYRISGSFSDGSAATIGGQGTLVATVSASQTVTVSGLTPGQTYSIAIVAQDGDNGNVAVYSPQSVLLAFDPVVVGALSAWPANSNTLSFSFTAATGGDGNFSYVAYLTPGTFSDPTVPTIMAEGSPIGSELDSNSVYSISGLTPATQYSVSVVVTNDQNVTAYLPQLVQMFTTGPTVAVYPVNVANGAFGGVGGADTACAQNVPAGLGSISVKAMLSDANNRIACSTTPCDSSQQLDWALSPNTNYIRPDGTQIGISDPQGYWVFPLANPPSATDSEWFSGLQADWTSADNCAEWSTTSGTGYVGFTGVTSQQGTLADFDVTCNQSNAQILCVQQPSGAFAWR